MVIKMTSEIKKRIEQIQRGEVPDGYKRTKAGIVPKEWAETSLGSYLQEYRELSNDIEKYNVYSSSRQGLIPQFQYYDNREVVETNLGYKVVPNGYVTYRHMSDDDVFHFNINNTGSSVLVSSEYPVFTTTGSGDLGYIIPMLNETPRFRYFCRTQKMGSTRTRLYFKNLCTYKTAFPPCAEQQKIAKILSTQDELIALKEKLIEEKKRQKKYLMQQLLMGEKRLPGYAENWITRHLNDISTSVNAKVGEEKYEVLSISAGIGFVNQAEKFGKEIAGEQYKNYTVLHKHDFSYNKGNSKRYAQGCIYPLENREIAAVPNVFISFRMNGAICYFGYYKYLFESGFLNKQLYRFINSGVRNDGLLNIYDADFYSCTVPVPPIDEQIHIANILFSADKEIGILQKELDQEKQKKKALMQLLLTGIVRVNI